MPAFTPILNPLINGVAYSFSHIELEIAGLKMSGGFKEIKYDRKRKRDQLRSNSPDPTAQTHRREQLQWFRRRVPGLVVGIEAHDRPAAWQGLRRQGVFRERQLQRTRIRSFPGRPDRLPFRLHRGVANGRDGAAGANDRSAASQNHLRRRRRFGDAAFRLSLAT
jgi:hypothetical protein